MVMCVCESSPFRFPSSILNEVYFFSSEPPGKSFFSYYVLNMSIFSCFIDHLYFVFCVKFTYIFCPFLCSAVWVFLYWFVDILYTFQRQSICVTKMCYKNLLPVCLCFIFIYGIFVLYRSFLSLFLCIK